MSNERYRIVRQMDFDTYTIGSPIQLEKGNLLLDSQTSNLILQLKLYNVSDKTISAVYLSADYYDNANHLLHSGIEVNYLGLHCAPKQDCGTDTPVKLPNNTIYYVDLNITKVMFIDGSMVDIAPQIIQIPKQQQISERLGNEAAGAARRVLNNQIAYIPQELDGGAWLCGCGQVNEKDVCICCSTDKDKLFEVVNGEYLQQVLEQEKQQRAEQEQKQAEQQERLKQISKKVAIIGTPIVAVVIAVTLLFTQIIFPKQQLHDINILVDSGQYDEALAELKNYEKLNTLERIDEIKQKKAVSLLDVGEYQNALALIAELRDISPIVSKIQETAAALLAQGDFENATPLYKIAGNMEPVIAALKEIREKNKEYRNKIADILNYIVGIKADGTVVAGGISSILDKYNVSDWTDIIEISAGGGHIVGLKADGTVVATGSNTFRECDVSIWTDIVSVQANGNDTIGIKADGTVVTTGWNLYGRYNLSDWTDIVKISALKSGKHTVGLKTDGTVVATGRNENKQCDVSDWTDIIDISAGYEHTVGLKADGTVVATGDNTSGECDVSGWTDIIEISAGSNHTVGLKADGTVVATGWNRFNQCNVENWTNIVGIVTSGVDTIGIKADGTVVATGRNEYKQLNISNWTDIVAISTNGYNTVGLKADGTVVIAGKTAPSLQYNISNWDLW